MRDAECEKDPLGAVTEKRTLVPLGCFLGWKEQAQSGSAWHFTPTDSRLSLKGPLSREMESGMSVALQLVPSRDRQQSETGVEIKNHIS